MDDADTFTSTDCDLVSYMIRRGLIFLRAEHRPGRSVFVLHDVNRRADLMRREFIQNVNLRRYLAIRRALRHAVEIARDSPSGVCTDDDLAPASAAGVRRKDETNRQPIPHEAGAREA